MRSFSIFTGNLSSREDANVRGLDDFEDDFLSRFGTVSWAAGAPASLDGSSEEGAAVTTSTLPACRRHQSPRPDGH